MNMKMICGNGHTFIGVQLDKCLFKHCSSRYLWIIEPTIHPYEKFEIIVRLCNENLHGIASVYDIEKAVSFIRKKFNSQNIEYSVRIKPIETNSPKIEGYAIVSGNIQCVIENKVSFNGFDFGLKKEYIGSTEIDDYKVSIFKIEFRSLNIISDENHGKILREFKRSFRILLKNNDYIKEILHLVIKKWRSSMQCYESDDPWMDIKNIY